MKKAVRKKNNKGRFSVLVSPSTTYSSGKSQNLGDEIDLLTKEWWLHQVSNQSSTGSNT